MKKNKNILLCIIIILLLTYISSSVNAIIYENFTTNNTFSLSADNVFFSKLIKYNSVWLNFNGVNSSIFINSPLFDVLTYNFRNSSISNWTTYRNVGPINYDINTVTYQKSYNFGSIDNAIHGLFFSSDGSKMYITGDYNAMVYQYSLSTSWDISSATYEKNFSVGNKDSSIYGLYFSSDGTKMYFVGNDYDSIYQYALSIPWDISSATYEKNLSVNNKDSSPVNLFFSTDGTKMYMLGYSSKTIYQYSLSTSWDISSATYEKNYSILYQDNSPYGLFFSPDGNRMYITGDYNDMVYQYSLSTSWDISSATYKKSYYLKNLDSIPVSVVFSYDGTKMYMLGYASKTAYQYSLYINQNYPIYYNGTGYFLGMYNSTKYFNGSLKNINFYNYSVPPFQYTVSTYYNITPIGYAFFNSSLLSMAYKTSPINIKVQNVTIAGWFKPSGILPDAYSLLLRADDSNNNPVYQLFSSDLNNSRAFFGSGSRWNYTYSGLVGTQPERWIYLAATYDNTNGIKIYANRYNETIYSIGDSITAGHPTHCTQVDNCAFSRGQYLNHTYQYWLDYYMGSFASAESRYKSYYNKGHGSETCDNIIARWDNPVDGLANNTKVMIMCGINDGMTNSTEIKQDYDQIVALAQARNQTLLWGQILPTSTGCAGSATYLGNMTDVNNYLEELAANYSFIKVIHWHMNLSNGTFGCYNSSLFADSVHPNVAGYEKMGKQMWYEGFNGIDYTTTLQEQRTFTYGAPFSMSSNDIANLYIGSKSYSYTYPYNGYMQNINLYNNSLSFSDLNYSFMANRTTFVDNVSLVSSWMMNSSEIIDLKGLNNLTNHNIYLYTNTSIDSISKNGVLLYMNFDDNILDSSSLSYSNATYRNFSASNITKKGYYNSGLFIPNSASITSGIYMYNINKNLSLYNTSFTISAWVNSSNFVLGTHQIIFGTVTNLNNFAYYFSLNSGSISFANETTHTRSTYTVGNKCVNKNWCHVAVTYDVSADQYYFYINGEEVGTDKSAFKVPSFRTNVTSATIGNDARDGIGYPVYGVIDELIVENNFRNATQMKDLYENGLRVLVSSFNLSEGTGNIVHDNKNYANVYYINNALWANDGKTSILSAGIHYTTVGNLITLLDHSLDWNLLTAEYYNLDSSVSGISQSSNVVVSNISLIENFNFVIDSNPTWYLNKKNSITIKVYDSNSNLIDPRNIDIRSLDNTEIKSELSYLSKGTYLANVYVNNVASNKSQIKLIITVTVKNRAKSMEVIYPLKNYSIESKANDTINSIKLFFDKYPNALLVVIVSVVMLLVISLLVISLIKNNKNI